MRENIVSTVRRKLLKTIPIITMASMIPKVSYSLARGGIASNYNPTPQPPFPSQPPVAATAGFNNLLIWDDFNSVATIDVNNTKNPGYIWYNDVRSPVVPASAYSVSNSILTINADLSLGHSANIQTPGYDGNMGYPNYRGIIIPPTGFYFEISMGWSLSPPGGAVHWPQAFFFDMNIDWCNAGDGTAVPQPYGEIDVMEAFSCPACPLVTIHQWNDCSSTNQVGGGYSFGGADLSQQHKYGCLWIPQSKNGGVNGVLKFYFDRVLQPGLTTTYSSPGTYSCLDRANPGLYLQIGTGSGWPAYFDYVQLWN